MKKYDIQQRVVLINPTELKGWIKKYAIGTILHLNRKSRTIGISFEQKNFKPKHFPFLRILTCCYEEVCPLDNLTNYQKVKVMKLKLLS